MSDFTMMTTGGIKQRMRCSGSVASTIESTFVTVEQLLDAIESEDDLSDRDGIGPKTEKTILEWYENREEREKDATRSTVNRTSNTSLSIQFHKSWEDAIAEREEA